MNPASLACAQVGNLCVSMRRQAYKTENEFENRTNTLSAS